MELIFDVTFLFADSGWLAGYFHSALRLGIALTVVFGASAAAHAAYHRLRQVC